MQSRRVLFRVVYGCIYLLLYVLLVGLLFVTPGDAIARSLHNDQNYNVWIVAVSFVVTVVVVCLVYMVRLWVTKTALGSIPKSWVPIEKGDVKDSVYKMIAAGLDRSAIIAYESQPRVEMMEREKGGGGGGGAAPRSRPGGLSTAEMASQELGITLPPPHAIWGDIEHNGWASPQSPDVPDLHYDTVLSELPNLIEGKALTLAPTDPTDRPA
ncbi:hypothetical protein CDD83_9322 [Cordyceps sp. RAO-2017]|nr:hypothetical protein CDD83_9322 [Cordyceps sp. RAO-2017]